MSTRWLSLSTGLFALSASVLVGAQAPGTASGSFTSQKMGTIAPKHAVAYLVRDQFDARTTEVEILLSEAPVDGKPMLGALDPHGVAINLDTVTRRNYVLVWVKPTGEVSMNATFGQAMTQFVDRTSDRLNVEFATRTPKRIEGRVFTAAPVKTNDGATYTVDLRFAVDVPPPSDGTALAVGGGEPGKAFTTFVAATNAKDWAAIRAGSSPTALKFFDNESSPEAEKAKEALDTLKIWVPLDKMIVTGGQLRGDVAILDVEGEFSPGDKSLAQVRMVKTGTTWRFDRAVRVGFVK
jgi:hypothetical protein